MSTNPEMLTLTEVRKMLPAKLLVVLGAPDLIKTNPNHKSGAPMQLFKRQRVEKFIAAHADDIAKSATRRKAAKTVSNHRADELIKHAKAIEIIVPKHPEAQTIGAAIDSYNNRSLEAQRDSWASITDSPAFIDRITVNYIRHKLTSYEDYLNDFGGLPGVFEAKTIIKARVIDAIAATYPRFVNECTRQRTDIVDGWD